MTLLITVFAAVITTVKWYFAENKQLKLGMLSFMYWGASLMWLVDALVEYIEVGEAFFHPALEDMINDAYLGLSVVALGLVIWVVSLLISDPTGRLAASLRRSR